MGRSKLKHVSGNSPTIVRHRLTHWGTADYKRSMELAGKVVVVTGGSMGIGEAIAKVFVDAGASVVLVSRDAGRSEAARGRIGHTERTLALACDVRRRDEIDRAVSLTLHHFDRIDVWINNAGYALLDSVAGMDLDACREMFETNLFGAVAGLQAVVPVLCGQVALPSFGVERVCGPTQHRCTAGEPDPD